MRVRKAQMSDCPAMANLIEEFFAASDFANLDISIDLKCTKTLAELLTKDQLMLVLETCEGKIVGGIGGYIMPFLLDIKIEMFQEIFFYVKKGFRHYSHFLLMELKRACKDLKLDRIIMAHVNDGTLETMERFYKERGFKKLETHFIARV